MCAGRLLFSALQSTFCQSILNHRKPTCALKASFSLKIQWHHTIHFLGRIRSECFLNRLVWIWMAASVGVRLQLLRPRVVDCFNVVLKRIDTAMRGLGVAYLSLGVDYFSNVARSFQRALSIRPLIVWRFHCSTNSSWFSTKNAQRGSFLAFLYDNWAYS